MDVTLRDATEEALDKVGTVSHAVNKSVRIESAPDMIGEMEGSVTGV